MIFETFSVFIGKIFGFSAFVGKVNGFEKPLSKEDEEKFFKLFKNDGDQKAKQKLINHNLRLVAHIVKKYSNANEADDLISVGTIGLIKGVNSFELGKGSSLSTYCARCIENEILMLIRSNKKHRSVVSLHEKMGRDKDGNEVELIDLLSADEDEIVNHVSLSLLSDKIQKAMNACLSQREKEIITLRFGIGGKPALAQREVAQKLGISRSYISRIEKKALAELGSFFS